MERKKNRRIIKKNKWKKEQKEKESRLGEQDENHRNYTLILCR